MGLLNRKLLLAMEMNKELVLDRLRAHQQELKRAGILRLAVFGSVARGEGNSQSDVDLMGDFDRAKRLSLLDMAGLELRLTEIVGIQVDLADRKMLKDQVKLRAEREAVLAFE
jgi:predicted nucleotidyltransferase